jgi:hypothetical protein
MVLVVERTTQHP